MPRPAPPCRVCTTRTKWLSFGACLADGLTVRASAERCGLAVNPAFRWRHRFLAAKDLKARKLTGIVEADETCVPESRKGARNLERKARRRGGKASKRGLSDEQVPVLVVADRSGATVSAVLPSVNADTLREVIAPVVDEDIVLVTDGHRACPRCAAAIGAHHEARKLIRSGNGAIAIAFPEGCERVGDAEASELIGEIYYNGIGGIPVDRGMPATSFSAPPSLTGV